MSSAKPHQVRAPFAVPELGIQEGDILQFNEDSPRYPVTLARHFSAAAVRDMLNLLSFLDHLRVVLEGDPQPAGRPPLRIENGGT